MGAFALQIDAGTTLRGVASLLNGVCAICPSLRPPQFLFFLFRGVSAALIDAVGDILVQAPNLLLIRPLQTFIMKLALASPTILFRTPMKSCAGGYKPLQPPSFRP